MTSDEGGAMKCWYILDMVCDRPPGKCEGCSKYDEWKKESDDLFDKFYNEKMKKEEEI